MPKQTFFNLPEEKRQKIIDLAIEEFSINTYSKASLSNVVARAGIAKGSMYQYFEDKKDLYTYLVELAAQKKMSYIQRHKLDQDDFFQMLEQLVMAGTQYNLENPKLGQLMASIMDPMAESFLRELYAGLRKQSYQYMYNLILENQQQGKLRKDVDPYLTAHLINGLLGNGLVEYFLERLNVNYYEFLTNPQVLQGISNEDIERVIKDIIKFIRNGLEGGK
ncbi:MAG: TetR/AcrR family transcriptional regulator [Bacillota bacterium]